MVAGWVGRAGFDDISDHAEFSIISFEDEERVKQEIAGINRLEIGDHSKRLLRATVYGAHDQFIDGVAELSVSVDHDTASDPDALRMIGDLYRLGRSYVAAAAEYFASLQLPAAANDSAAGQALSHESLGVMHEALKDTVGPSQTIHRRNAFTHP
jgi:hypothetical protein